MADDEIEGNAEVAMKFCNNEKIASASSKLHEVKAEMIRKKTNPPRVERKLSGGDNKTPQPKIQRVTQVLKDEQKGLEMYYDPKWISIGPIHHGNPKFKLAEERFKFLFAAKFVENSGHQSHDLLYRKIMERIEELKQCFDEEVLEEYYSKENGNDDETLGWMLFLDGCFTLQFIHSTVKDELSSFEIKNDQSAFVYHDFFLLENQIPYLVLRLLMGNSEKEFCSSLQSSMMKFLNLSVLTPEKYRSDRMVIPSEMPVHLLDFLRLQLLQPSYHVKKRSKSCAYTYLLACLPRSLRNKLVSDKD